MRFYALLLLAVVGTVTFFGFIGSFLDRKRKRAAFHSAINAEKQKRDNIWKEAENVKTMVNLYMTMVIKHGPSSDEAKAFRFGTDSRLMRELHGDSEAREAFQQQADIIDQTVRNMFV